MNALDDRLEAAGWTYSMVQDWRFLRSLGWGPVAAMRRVRQSRRWTVKP